MLQYLLPAGEDPGQRQAPVGHRVHQRGVGVGQEGLEEPLVRPRPSSGQPRLAWSSGACVSNLFTSCTGLSRDIVSIFIPSILNRLVSRMDGSVDDRIFFRLILDNSGLDAQELENADGTAAVDDDGGDDDEEGRAQDHLSAFRDGVPDGKSEGNGSS